MNRLTLLDKVWEANDQVAHLTLAVMCILLLIAPLELIVLHSRLAFLVLTILIAGLGVAYLLTRLDRGIFDERIDKTRTEIERNSFLF